MVVIPLAPEIDLPCEFLFVLFLPVLLSEQVSVPGDEEEEEEDGCLGSGDVLVWTLCQGLYKNFVRDGA